MLIVIDIGNTRAKWAELTDGQLSDMQVAPNATFAQSALKNRLAHAEKVVIANVAGDAIAQQLMAIIPEHVTTVFVKATNEACSVINRYRYSTTLGVDRWAAVVAVWNQLQQPAIVVNAGTAITIDSVTADSPFKLTVLNRIVSKKGVYLGGTIMPGLYAMQHALGENTAKLPSDSTGEIVTFPDNTADAMQTGVMNAVVGSVLLQLKQLEKHCAFLPKIVITGGDAVKIALELKKQVKRVVIAEDLVLQGLALLEKE